MANDISFRGYLSGLSNDAGAQHLLQMVGNDGRVGEGGAYTDSYNKFYGPGAGQGPTATAQQLADQYYKAYLKTKDADTPNNTPADPGSVYDQSQVNYYNQLINQVDNKLGSLGSQLAELNKSTQGAYNTYLNEAKSRYDTEKGKYDLQTTQNQQNLQTERNKVMDTASRGLRGLQRLLGARGAGGSSAALYLAPEAVAAQANQQLAGVNQTFGQNQQNIDSQWTNFKSDYDNDLKKLADWKVANERANERNIINQRKDLLTQKATAYAERGKYGIGDGGQQAAITNEINAQNDRMNELAKYVQPTYNGITAAFKAPTVSSYFEKAGQPTVNTQVGNNTAGTGQATTALQLLSSLKKKDEE